MYKLRVPVIHRQMELFDDLLNLGEHIEQNLEQEESKEANKTKYTHGGIT